MNRILTCTDGSAYAPGIYEHTAWAAKRSAASVHVLHMLDAHRERAEIADLSGNIGIDSGSELLTELVTFEETKNRLAREKGKAVLAAARRYFDEVGVSEVTVGQQHGELVETVTQMEVDVDLVVMGKRGEAADFAKLHLGSNLERVIRASIRPVLVASRKFAPIERLVVAYDGGPSVEKAIAFMIEHPLLKGLACHLIRAGRIDADAKWFLQETASKLVAAGYEGTSRLRRAIRKRSSVRRSSLTPATSLMGAYGHSRMRYLIVGSTTTAMVRSCQIPVLMCR